jgi:hypothetical protein
MSRPREARKAIPTPTAMPALAPVGNGSVLNGVGEELGGNVWLTAAAVEGVVDDVEIVNNEVAVVMTYSVVGLAVEE